MPTLPSITDEAKQRLAQAARNDIAWGLMGLMDDLYNVYSANLYSGKGAIAVTGDAANLGLTTAVAIAGRTAAKTLFGALGTAITGISLSVDKNAFAQQTYQVIALAMETRRTAIYTEISDGLAKKTVLEYPLTAVKRDLVLYLYAGSLPGGCRRFRRKRERRRRPPIRRLGRRGRRSSKQEPGGIRWEELPYPAAPNLIWQPRYPERRVSRSGATIRY